MSSSSYNLTVLQGADFQEQIRYFLGDITEYSIRGQIRKGFAYENGELLASFVFDNLVYESVVKADGTTAMATTTLMRLPNSITQSIPITPALKTLSDGYIKGCNCWVYDVEVVSPENIVTRILSGYVVVSPEVTSE